MSSSAFFIEAAAKTVMVLSWAAAGGPAATPRASKAKRKRPREVMAILHPAAAFRRGSECRDLHVPANRRSGTVRPAHSGPSVAAHPSDPAYHVKPGSLSAVAA